MNYTVHGILQARILEWVAFPFCWGSSQPRLNASLPHCRQILYQLSHKGSPRILEWVAYPFSRGSSQPRSPALQADSLPAEPQGKPKNTRVGSLALLQRIFPTQESNWGLLHYRWFFTNWAIREALFLLWLNNIPLYIYAILCIFIHPLTDIWVVSTFWLRWTWSQIISLHLFSLRNWNYWVIW